MSLICFYRERGNTSTEHVSDRDLNEIMLGNKLTPPGCGEYRNGRKSIPEQKRGYKFDCAMAMKQSAGLAQISFWKSP